MASLAIRKQVMTVAMCKGPVAGDALREMMAA